MPDQIDIIINPNSGKEEPILSFLAKAFKDTPIKWKVHVTATLGEAAGIARSLAGKTSMVAAYGGDGTVMEVAQGLYGSDTPMAILPGGTANVMAKEMGIPTDSPAAIALLASGDYDIRSVDMGIVNDIPFLIRINMGIFSDMITEASPEMKDRWGQWAYGFTALQTIQKDPTLYELTVDGKTFREEAVALTIANAGNIGRQGYSFLPDISVSDGWLDVVLINQSDIMTLLKAAGSAALQQESSVIRHWKGKEIIVRTQEKQSFIRDDLQDEAQEWRISIVPHSLNIIVPHGSK